MGVWGSFCPAVSEVLLLISERELYKLLMGICTFLASSRKQVLSNVEIQTNSIQYCKLSYRREARYQFFSFFFYPKENKQAP